jgi:hypothetical protein
MNTSKAAKQLGKLGGKAGKGKAKVRGNSEYYRTIRKKRKQTEEKMG